MTTDLERAYDALSGKQAKYSTLWDYYDGNHPLVYSTQRLRDIFKDINARFSLNWAAVIVDSVADRLQLQQFTVADDDEATTVLNELFVSTELALDDADVHKAALVTGEAFVFAWLSGDGAVEAYYNDPRLCHVFYDAENPRRKAFAAKWWVGQNKRRYLNLYYPDRIWYFVSTSAADEVQSAKNFMPVAEMPEAENPFGEIPVFHFRPERRIIKSELDNVVEPQNAANKLFADMMVAAEFGAFKQRYIISNMDTKGRLKNAPNEIWDLPAADGQVQQTSVGEFSATELGNYLEALDRITSYLAIITRTPKHYFFSQGGDPSGEALIAMEAPLNKKCDAYIERLKVPWQRLAAFMLRLSGVDVQASDIQVLYADPETVQPRTRAEIRQIDVNAGIPLVTVLRREGWTQKELDGMEDDRSAERAAQTNSLALALLQQQRQFDQNNNGNTGAPLAAPAQGAPDEAPETEEAA